MYDLTNTYFEGRMANSLLANHGRSKEKRNDAKLIVLALIVNQYGFLKYSDQASMAHLHLGLMAYWIVSTIRYQLKLKGVTHDRR